MHNRHAVFALVCIAGFTLGALPALIGSDARAAETSRLLGPRLQRMLLAVEDNEPIVAWVFLTDKGAAGKQRVPQNVVSLRSLARRAKVMPYGKLVQAQDLPVAQAYVDAIAGHVQLVRKQSRWFNAVSVQATRAQLLELAELSFVKEIELVLRFRKNADFLDIPQEISPTPHAADKQPTPNIAMLDYGASFAQLDQIGVPTLHNQGINGQGVLIGHFDNGHRLLSHESLSSLQIVATRDFVDGDIDPAPDPADPSSWGGHGILTLSALAGFKEGQLIGPAYGASFLLARTENDASETPLEEDNWVAAMEWADSMGVDVVSSSLAYLGFDNPFPSWTWEDMDGNTTVITRAADHAVALGIVVVNSAANNGLPNVGEGNSLMAPADGDSVLTIGSVTNLGVRSSFSSVGPTVDGRFKPDLMAQGTSTRCASFGITTGYVSVSGTSLSCPLAAGVVAQLLSAQPTATPMLIRDALRLTASQAMTPDNLNGWGIINAIAALSFLELLETSDTADVAPSGTTRIVANIPNPFNPRTTISYELAERSNVSLRIFDGRGRVVRTLIATAQTAQRHQIVWDGTNDAGTAVGSGIYFARLQTRGGTAPAFEAIRKMTLVR